jgi:thioredoxin-like negative regulator of GroEL
MTISCKQMAWAVALCWCADVAAQDGSTNAAAAVRWTTSLDRALATASKSGRPVLVSFTADWCGWCRAMENETYADPVVVKAAGAFECVKVNVDRDSKTAFTYKIQSLPRTLVLNAKGDVVGDMVGYMDAHRLLSFLRDAVADGAVPVNVEKSPPPTLRLDSATAADPTKLVALLSSTDVAGQRQVMDALVKLGQTAWPALAVALTDDYLGTRIAAHTVLKKTCPAKIAYSPWDPRDVRERSAAKWRTWVSQPSLHATDTAP